MITIAILDDGICSASFPSLRQVDCSIAATENGVVSKVDEPSQMTHGTLCAAIVRSYAPERMKKAKSVGTYLQAICNRDGELAIFDPRVWMDVIEQVTVYRDGRMVFQFKDGKEIEA